jgi:1,4-alpha-glucan branching enzyme
MVKKRNAKNGHMKVTFELAAPEAHSVQLAGDFNGWTREPMERTEDGRWSKSLKLDTNHKYEYRYVLDGDRWVNESNADSYAPNAFGSENCVLCT